MSMLDFEGLMKYIRECIWHFAVSLEVLTAGTFPSLSDRSPLPGPLCSVAHRVSLFLIQGSKLNSSFAGFLRHLLLSGLVSLFVFPCQQPLKCQ